MKIEEIYREIIKIHSILDNYHNQLNANKEKFEKIYNETISSMTEIRNILLTIFTILAGFSGFTVAITAITDLNYSSIVFLIILVIVGIGVYIGFFFIKRERNKKVLDILKEFHDGFTTISFMKGFLDKISLVFENLETKQIDVLDDYYTMVKGEGIAFQIRSKIEKSVKGGIKFPIRRLITKSVKEAAAYGCIEGKLYSMLIYNASKIYEVQKKSGKKEEEEKLLKELFLFHNEKYNYLLEDEKKFYKEKYNSLPLKEKVFDKYKNVLENSSENSISEREEDSQKSLLQLMNHYKIPLELQKIED